MDRVRNSAAVDSYSIRIADSAVSALRFHFRRRRSKKTLTADEGPDLCAVCDGVSLLCAEVRQDVCRVSLTGVVNSRAPCKEKCFQSRF